MSDREVILRLLVAVERRLRRNRLLRDVSFCLSVALLILVGFKLVDLLSPFRGTTVVTVFTIWAVATTAWMLWQCRGSRTLDRTAAHIDQTADTHDEIKTAYWFMNHPKPSPWVDAQIQRAAKNAAAMQMDSLCPRIVPRASYSVAALILILAILNFLPLPWNNNWLYLQAAPAFSLTGGQKAMLDRALEVLKKAEALQQTDIAEKLAAIVQGLQSGTLSRDEFSRSLSELQRTLSERNLDAGQMTDGLERIARALEGSPLTNAAAGKVSALDLQSAADEIREISKGLNQDSPAAVQEMAERFHEASDTAGKGLEQLAKDLQEASNAMGMRDVPGSQKTLEQVAGELEKLQRTLDSQRLRSQASEQISALKDSIGGDSRERSGAQESLAQNGEQGQGQGQGAGQGEEKGQGTGEGKGDGQGQGEGQGQGQGQGDGKGEGEGQGDGQGMGDGEGGGDGRGGKTAGRSGPAPGRGEPTSLETQLDREELPILQTRPSRSGTTVEASERERSKLDYRNVPSQLSPAQKDLLNQDSIPWEQRRFVKEYFETIRK